jgi:hypothetical protein
VLILTGWTANPSIHWIVGVIGLTIYAASVFIILQCIFVYIPLSYPQYAASLFAGNDFCRSAFAFGSVLYGRALYVNLGVGKGVSLLGGLSVLGIVSVNGSSDHYPFWTCWPCHVQQIGMFVLYFYGAKLRAKSKFAVGWGRHDISSDSNMEDTCRVRYASGIGTLRVNIFVTLPDLGISEFITWGRQKEQIDGLHLFLLSVTH